MIKRYRHIIIVFNACMVALVAIVNFQQCVMAMFILLKLRLWNRVFINGVDVSLSVHRV